MLISEALDLDISSVPSYSVVKTIIESERIREEFIVDNPDRETYVEQTIIRAMRKIHESYLEWLRQTAPIHEWKNYMLGNYTVRKKWYDNYYVTTVRAEVYRKETHYDLGGLKT